MFDNVVSDAVAQPVADAVAPPADRAAAAAPLLEAATALRTFVGDGTGCAPDERAALLGTLQRVEGVLASVRARLVVAERETEEWRSSGARSFEASRATSTRAGMGAAFREVRQAETLTSMPQLAEAVEAGQVPLAHVDALARTAATASPALATVLASPENETEVVRLAQQLDAPEFARAVTRLAATQDPAAVEDAHQAQRRGRYLRISDADDGTHVRGRLDLVTGHRLRLALEAAGDAPDAERSGDQARADALATLAETTLSLPENGSGAAARPHVALLMREETFAALRAAQVAADAAHAADIESHVGDGRCAGDDGGDRIAGNDDGDRIARDGRRAGTTDCGRGAVTATTDVTTAASTHAALRPHAVATPVVGTPPVTLEDGTVVPTSEVARALCDSEITRIVVDALDQPLNLGLTQRLYTGVQRRAVIARDRGCAWPGCSAPPRHCEVHHIRWWERDRGPTSVLNGVLLCAFHHHQVHRWDLSIERDQPPPGVTRPRARRTGAALPGGAPADSPEGTVVPVPLPIPDGSPAGSEARRVTYTFRRPNGTVIA